MQEEEKCARAGDAGGMTYFLFSPYIYCFLMRIKLAKSFLSNRLPFPSLLLFGSPRRFASNQSAALLLTSWDAIAAVRV